MTVAPPKPWTAALLLAVMAAAGCEGITVEIVKPVFPEGASPVAAWELWLEPLDGSCRAPRDLSFEGERLSLPAPADVAPLDAITLSPGRYSILAIGRDESCAPILFGQTCIGPEAPPRVISVTTCDIGAERCVDVDITAPDRAALECAGSCDAGVCVD